MTGAQCGNSARWDLCGGPSARTVPTATNLVSEITRLNAALIDERLISANLRAAIRAALGAQAHGETDPLGYLRDELPNLAGGGAYGA